MSITDNKNNRYSTESEKNILSSPVVIAETDQAGYIVWLMDKVDYRPETKIETI